MRGNAEKLSRVGEEIRSSAAYKGCRESGKEQRKVWKEWSKRQEETQIWIVLPKPREKEFQGRCTHMSAAAEVTSSGGWLIEAPVLGCSWPCSSSFSSHSCEDSFPCSSSATTSTSSVMSSTSSWNTCQSAPPLPPPGLLLPPLPAC